MYLTLLSCVSVYCTKLGSGGARLSMWWDYVSDSPLLCVHVLYQACVWASETKHVVGLCT